MILSCKEYPFNPPKASISVAEQFDAADLFKELGTQSLLAHVDLPRDDDTYGPDVRHDSVSLRAVIAEEEFVEDYVLVSLDQFEVGPFFLGNLVLFWESGKHRNKSVRYCSSEEGIGIMKSFHDSNKKTSIQQRFAEIMRFSPPNVAERLVARAVMQQIVEESEYIPALHADLHPEQHPVGVGEMKWLSEVVNYATPHPFFYPQLAR